MPSRETIEHRLDEVEKRLPRIPAASLRLQRLIGTHLLSVASSVVQAWQDSARAVTKAATTAVKTVRTTRFAGEEVVDAAQTAVQRVPGQAEAGQVVDAVAGEAATVADSVTHGIEEPGGTALDAGEAVEGVVDPDVEPSGESYDDLTKAELYRQAAAREISGRSKMSKQQLIDALRAAD